MLTDEPSLPETRGQDLAAPVAADANASDVAPEESAYSAAVLARLAGQAARLLGVEHAAIFVCDDTDPRTMVLSAATGAGAGSMGEHLGIDEGISGRAIKSRHAVLMDESCPASVPHEGSEKVRSGAAVPIRWSGRIRGAVAVSTEDRKRDFGDHELDLLVDISDLAAAALEHAAKRAQSEDTLQVGIEALASLIELRDGYTARHSDQVVYLARRLGKRLGLDEQALCDLITAARVHDIGKIGIPDGILLKPGALDENEWRVMRRHADWGADTLERIPGLERVAKIVRHHHERWDGGGYPQGLRGDTIPIASRVIAVCDAFGAMVSTRPYRRALDVHEAVRLLRAGSGVQFDARVVETLSEIVEDISIPGGDQAPPDLAREIESVREVATAPAEPVRRGDPKRMRIAFERLTALPALRESRDRLLALLEEPQPSLNQVVVTIESDVALVAAVLGAANRAAPKGTEIASVPAAVEALSTEGVRVVVARLPTFDFFQPLPGWKEPEQFRLHALATQQAATRLARELVHADQDVLLVAALLHDVGKLVLAAAVPGYPEKLHRGAHTPEERIAAENRHLGADHAAVGGVLIRRWGLPAAVALAVEQHHTPGAGGHAGLLRVADMLAHYGHGRPIDPRELEGAAKDVGLGADSLRTLMFDLGLPRLAQRRAVQPSPLSVRETRALQELAKGQTYKEIAAVLCVAPSTVRSHLHSTYRKIGAADRAQAVLIATERGWI